jgi:class 3 adenylate cyclase
MDFDVSARLPEITMPTLLLQHKRFPAESSQLLAAAMPGARLYLHEQLLQFDAAARAMLDEFLAEGDDESLTRGPGGTSIILLTDIVESTSLTERMGDAAFRDASRALDERTRAAIRDAGGAPIAGKVLGDGVMGVFSSAAQAIAAARACLEAARSSGLQLHIGLHAGDVIRESDNVYGGAVNIASRICGLSSAGEVLVSQTVRELARTSAGVRFEDRGERALKGIADPVRVFAVRDADA